MTQVSSPFPGRANEHPSSIDETMDEAVAQAVLNVYTSAHPKGAFEAAVRAYRERNWSVSANAARRAVARIICCKA
jgi:hypothetical protein